MNFKYSLCVISLSLILMSCGGVPEANSVNCSGRALESSLQAFDNETERQAFIDACNALEKK